MNNSTSALEIRLTEILQRMVAASGQFPTPSSRAVLGRVRVGGSLFLAARTGSYQQGSIKVVRNMYVNGVLIRHASGFLVPNANGEPIVVHRSTPAGVIRVFVLRTS